MSAGIYIHIPFCAHKCPYCDFYSVAYDDGLCSKYIAAIGRETEAFPPLSADTIYFGGGTPSLLRTEHIECMLNAVRSRFNIADGAEITLECNPATCDREKLRDLHSLGINRLSVGVQSTDDAVLQAAGRLHNGDQALRTLSDAALAGFDNVSADLMIALPQDDGRALDRSISDVTSTGAKHVSAYLLKLMPQTPFGEQAPDGLPDDDDQALLYEHCCNALEHAGFRQYEISNFALAPEYKSRHNLKYWDCGEWVGLGAAAHSCLSGMRYSHKRDLRAFTETFSDSAALAQDSYISLLDFEGKLDADDFIMLKLRTADGLSLAELYSKFNFKFNKQKVEFIEQIAAAGLAIFNGKTLTLTRKGLLVSNSIIVELI